MAGSRRDVEPISASVDVLRRQFGLARRDRLEVLADGWSDLVGADVAANSVLIDLRNGTLTVDVGDSATADVLAWSKRRVVSAARDLCPDERIVDLRVRVRPHDRGTGPLT